MIRQLAPDEATIGQTEVIAVHWASGLGILTGIDLDAGAASVAWYSGAVGTRIDVEDLNFLESD